MVIRVSIDRIGLFNGKIKGIYKTIDGRIIYNNLETTIERLIDESVSKQREVSFINYCSDKNCDFLDERKRIENGVPVQGTYVIFREPETIMVEGYDRATKLEILPYIPQGTIIQTLAHTHPLREGALDTYHSNQDRDAHTGILKEYLPKGILTISFVLGKNEGKAIVPVVEMDNYIFYKNMYVPQVRSFQLALIYNCIQKMIGNNYRISYNGYVPEPTICNKVKFEEIPIKYMFREPYITIIETYKILPPIK